MSADTKRRCRAITRHGQCDRPLGHEGSHFRNVAVVQSASVQPPAFGEQMDPEKAGGMIAHGGRPCQTPGCDRDETPTGMCGPCNTAIAYGASAAENMIHPCDHYREVASVQQGEQRRIAQWLRGMEERHYPKDVWPDPDVPLTDAPAASVLRRFAPIWANQIEAGEHHR